MAVSFWFTVKTLPINGDSTNRTALGNFPLRLWCGLELQLGRRWRSLADFDNNYLTSTENMSKAFSTAAQGSQRPRCSLLFGASGSSSTYMNCKFRTDVHCLHRTLAKGVSRNAAKFGCSPVTEVFIQTLPRRWDISHVANLNYPSMARPGCVNVSLSPTLNQWPPGPGWQG